jgi:hypothetical protein
MVSDRDVVRIAAEASLDPRTVRRALEGLAMRSRATLDAIADACRKLRIANPTTTKTKRAKK